MPACAFCGVNMAVAEVTQRPYDGVLGNYHRDCAYMEYLYNSGATQSFPTLVSEVNISFRDKLRRRKMQQALPIAAPTVTGTAGTTIPVGTYKYAVTLVDQYGESIPGAQQTITYVANSQVGSITNIPLGPSPLTTARKIYRTTVGGTQLKLLTTISDNVTTTFTDNTLDGSLGANAPTVSLFAQKDFP